MSAVAALGVAGETSAALSLDLVEIGYVAEDGMERRASSTTATSAYASANPATSSIAQH